MAEKTCRISFWQRLANRNWETACYLKESNHHLMTLFMFHLTIEKLMKAHWVKDNVDDLPPRTHDIQLLYNQTDLSLPEWYDFLAIVNNWNIDTRYPDYKDKIYRLATSDYVSEQFTKVEKLKQCLQDAH